MLDTDINANTEILVFASLGFLFTTSFVMFSCLSCRRYLEKRRLKKQKKKREKVEIPEIKIDLGEQEKQENGITNPGYQETEEKKTKEQQIQKENGESKEPEVEETKDSGVEATVKMENETGTENKSIEEAVLEENKMGENVEADKVDDALSDLSDIQSKSAEEIKSDVEEPPSPPPEPTIIYQNNLTEEELEAYSEAVFQGEWRQPVTLKSLLEIGLISTEIADEIIEEDKKSKERMQNEEEIHEEHVPDKIKKFLCGEEPVAGILVMDTGEKRSIFKSAKDGILRRGTAISLLEAQAATGNIIDPVTGRKMSVKEATQLGLLDKVYETVLLRAERAVIGYKFRASETVLSLYEAMQKGLVVESHGLRLLEAQCATGGIIDHRTNIRVPLDIAIRRGLLDEKLKAKLEDDDGEETKTFFDPNTEENVTYKELMKRSIVDDDTGLRLYPLERIARKRISYGSYSGRSSQSSSRTVSRSNSRENLNTTGTSP